MGGKEIKEKIIDLMFKNFGNCPKRLPTQILKLFNKTDKIILTPEKQKAIRKNFQELENSIRLLKKEIKEMPEIDYEKVYQYDSYTYLLLHKAFEEEGMKLKKGDKVIPTKWAIQNGICKEKDKGIVVGFGRNLSSIRIKKNNLKTISSYWSGFWRLKDEK